MLVEACACPVVLAVLIKYPHLESSKPANQWQQPLAAGGGGIMNIRIHVMNTKKSERYKTSSGTRIRSGTGQSVTGAAGGDASVVVCDANDRQTRRQRTLWLAWVAQQLEGALETFKYTQYVL